MIKNRCNYFVISTQITQLTTFRNSSVTQCIMKVILVFIMITQFVSCSEHYLYSIGDIHSGSISEKKHAEMLLSLDLIGNAHSGNSVFYHFFDIHDALSNFTKVITQQITPLDSVPHTSGYFWCKHSVQITDTFELFFMSAKNISFVFSGCVITHQNPLVKFSYLDTGDEIAHSRNLHEEAFTNSHNSLQRALLENFPSKYSKLRNSKTTLPPGNLASTTQKSANRARKLSLKTNGIAYYASVYIRYDNCKFFQIFGPMFSWGERQHIPQSYHSDIFAAIVINGSEFTWNYRNEQQNSLDDSFIDDLGGLARIDLQIVNSRFTNFTFGVANVSWANSYRIHNNTFENCGLHIRGQNAIDDRRCLSLHSAGIPNSLESVSLISDNSFLCTLEECDGQYSSVFFPGYDCRRRFCDVIRNNSCDRVSLEIEISGSVQDLSRIYTETSDHKIPFYEHTGTNIVNHLLSVNSVSFVKFVDLISARQPVTVSDDFDLLYHAGSYCIVSEQGADHSELNSIFKKMQYFDDIQFAIDNCDYSLIIIDRKTPLVVRDGLNLSRSPLKIMSDLENKEGGVIVSSKSHRISHELPTSKTIIQGITFLRNAGANLIQEPYIQYKGSGDTLSICNSKFISIGDVIFSESLFDIGSVVSNGKLQSFSFKYNQIRAKSQNQIMLIRNVANVSVVENSFALESDCNIIVSKEFSVDNVEILRNSIINEIGNAKKRKQTPAIFSISLSGDGSDLSISDNVYSHPIPGTEVKIELMGHAMETKNIFNNLNMIHSFSDGDDIGDYGDIDKLTYSRSAEEIALEKYCIIDSVTLYGDTEIPFRQFSDIHDAIRFCQGNRIVVRDKISILDWSLVKGIVSLELVGEPQFGINPIILCTSSIILSNDISFVKMCAIDFRIMNKLADNHLAYHSLLELYPHDKKIHKNTHPINLSFENCSFTGNGSQGKNSLIRLSKSAGRSIELYVNSCKFKEANYAIDVDFSESILQTEILVSENEFYQINCSAIQIRGSSSFSVTNNRFYDCGGQSKDCSSMVYLNPSIEAKGPFSFEDNQSFQYLLNTHPTSGSILNPHWVSTYWLHGFSTFGIGKLSIKNNSCIGHPVGMRLSDFNSKTDMIRSDRVTKENLSPFSENLSEFVESTSHCAVFGYFHDILSTDIIHDSTSLLNSSSVCSSDSIRGFINGKGLPILLHHPDDAQIVPSRADSLGECKCPFAPPPFCIVDYSIIDFKIKTELDSILSKFLGTWIFSSISRAVDSCKDPYRTIVVRNNNGQPVIKENIVISRAGFSIIGDSTLFPVVILGSHIVKERSTLFRNIVFLQEDHSPVWIGTQFLTSSQSPVIDFVIDNCTICASSSSSKSSIIGLFENLTISNSTFKGYDFSQLGSSIIEIEDRGKVTISNCTFSNIYYTAINISSCGSYRISDNAILMSNYTIPPYISLGRFSDDHIVGVHCKTLNPKDSLFSSNSLDSKGMCLGTGFWLESYDVNENISDSFGIPTLLSNRIQPGVTHIGLRIGHHDSRKNYLYYSKSYHDDLKTLLSAGDNLNIKGSWHDVLLTPPVYDTQIFEFPHKNYEHICDSGCQTSDYIGIAILVVLAISVCCLLCLCVGCGSRKLVVKPIVWVHSRTLNRNIPADKKYWPTILYGYFPPWGHQARPIPSYMVDPIINEKANENDLKVSSIITSSTIK